MSRLITRHITLIERLYNIFKQSNHSKLDKDRINYIEKEHKTLVEKFVPKFLRSKELVEKIVIHRIYHKMLIFHLLQLKSLLLKERIKL